ncbi:hypothetical protein JN11_04134 [Mucilaginibacter frigoritolerans]|uniref:Uncharacterized protein n=1 Tax=Mucilaginibacter frigoritolerans TaxID=652788 RepID=A0A562TQK5_9SPHI|nr:hypothetical protein [Mucilaginibacter frigoritolerans]TWI95859.1 hypothetical protein JN11_04134 [Mucilaginibacter frigoritolerans]
MKNIKDELQHIILGDEPAGQASKLKKVQRFLRSDEETSFAIEKQQWFKSKETTALLAFAEKEDIIYTPAIDESDFISEGAEQKVYRFDGSHVIKTNGGIFYECWFDYFNSLLIHNYFFPSTAYTFLGFKMIAGELNAVVMQEFIMTSEPTNLATVKEFLAYNNFHNTRNNDYINYDLGLIFENLHDENVLSIDSVLFFIDTVFYLTEDFYTT